MEDLENLKSELGKLGGMVYTVKEKVHDLAGLLELVHLGMMYQDEVGDSYGMCCVNLIQEYLKVIVITDMENLYSKVTELKEKA